MDSSSSFTLTLRIRSSTMYLVPSRWTTHNTVRQKINVIRDKSHDTNDQMVRKAILQWKRHLAAVAAGPVQHIFCWSDDWWLLWRSDVATCKHCFMTCNTISFASWLVRKCFRREFLDIFEDVCSLHTGLSANSFRHSVAQCYANVLDAFYVPPGILYMLTFSHRNYD